MSLAWHSDLRCAFTTSRELLMSPLTQRNTERTTARRQTSTERRRTWIYGVVSALLLWSHTVAGAQSYDPAVQSPLNLLTSPPDPVAYFDARQRARALLG